MIGRTAAYCAAACLLLTQGGLFSQAASAQSRCEGENVSGEYFPVLSASELREIITDARIGRSEKDAEYLSWLDAIPPLREVCVVTDAGDLTVDAKTTILGEVAASVLVHKLKADGEDTFVAAIEVSNLRLDQLAGARLGTELSLPNVLFALAERPIRIDTSALTVRARRFYHPFLAEHGGAWNLRPGMNLTTSLGLDFLPDPVTSVLGITTDAQLRFDGRLTGNLAGKDEGPRELSLVTDITDLVSSLPVPELLGAPVVRSMHLGLANFDDLAFTTLKTEIDVELGGLTRSLSGSSFFPLGETAEDFQIDFAMREGWKNPFGLEWLRELRDVRLSIRWPGGPVDARIDGVFDLELSRNTRVRAGIRLPTGPGSRLEIVGTVDALSLDDVRRLLRLQIGPAADTLIFPGGLPSIENVLFSFSPSTGSMVLTGRTDLSVEFDGAVRRFNVEPKIRFHNGNISTSFRGMLIGEWKQPFGLTWIDTELVTIGLKAGSASGIGGELSVVGKLPDGQTVDFGFSIDSDKVSVHGKFDRIDTGFVQRLIDPYLQDTVFDLSSDAIDISFTNVGLNIVLPLSPAAPAGLAIYDHRNRNYIVSAHRAQGDSQLVFAIKRDNWGLGDVLPLEAGSALNEMRFDSAALVFAKTGGTVDTGAFGEAERAFFGAFGTQTAGIDGLSFGFDIQPGVSLLARVPIDKHHFLYNPLRTLGFDEGRLVLAGSIPGRFLGVSGGSTSLLAALPPITRPSPELLREVQLGVFVRKPSEVARPQIGFQGKLSVQLNKDLLDFDISAAFDPPAVTIGGGLIQVNRSTDGTWRNPLGLVPWLELGSVSAEFRMEPLRMDLGVNGKLKLSTKDLDLNVGIGVSSAGPDNIAFQFRSDSSLGIGDLIELQQLMAGTSIDMAPLLALIPDLELRPLRSGEPLTLMFAVKPYHSSRFTMKDCPVDIPAPCMSVKGALWGSMNSGQPKVELARTDSRINVTELRLDGEAYGPIALPGIVLTNPQVFMMISPLKLHSELRVKGALDTYWGATRVNVRVGGQARIDDVFATVVKISDAFAHFILEFADNPVRATQSAQEGLFSLAGVPTPAWMSDLFDNIATVTGHASNLAARQVMHTALNGLSIPLPAGQGVPRGGTAPDRCPIEAPLPHAGRCYTRLGVAKQPGELLCPGDRWLGDLCVDAVTLIQAGARIPKKRDCIDRGFIFCREYSDWYCPDGWEPDGRLCRFSPVTVDFGCDGVWHEGECVKVRPVPFVPPAGVSKVCGLSLTSKHGRCWIVAPRDEVQVHIVKGVCKQPDFNVSCNVDDFANVTISNLIKRGVDELLREHR